jgi:hypothetical protein
MQKSKYSAARAAALLTRAEAHDLELAGRTVAVQRLRQGRESPNTRVLIRLT